MADAVVILFHSTSHAIHAERVLQRAGLSATLVPTPRHLSSDCGSALRISPAEQSRAEELLAAAGVPLDRIEPLGR